MFYLIFASILFALSQLAMLFLVKRYLDKQKKQALEYAKLYFEPQAEGESSQFAKFVDLVAQNFASRIVSSIRAQLMNLNSIQTRQQNAIEGALAQDMAAAQSPMIGAALAAFPQLGKLIRKNPAMLDIIQGVLAKTGGAAQKQPAPSNGHIDQLEY